MKPLLSVIVPMARSHQLGAESLAAIAASDLPREFWELVVVADGASAAISDLAAPYADRVLQLHGQPHGPSYARNRGADVARGEILVFVDSDICIRPDVLRRLTWLFVDEPDLAAAYGRYQDDGQGRGLISQYRDLLNHHLHHFGLGEHDGFWSECAAVRREAFVKAGMFDEWRFPRPQIEALELGKRFRDQGFRVVYRPEIQARHLKRWTFAAMVAADLRDRGVPQSRLLMKGKATAGAPRQARWPEILSALFSWAAFILAAYGAFRSSGPAWLGALAAVVVVVGLNRRVFDLFRRAGGPLFAVATVPLHLVHAAVAGVAMVLGVVLHHWVGDPQPSATDQAFSEVGVVKWPPVPKQLDQTRRRAEPSSGTPGAGAP